VTLFDALEHLDDDTEALRKAAGPLNAGGRIVLTVPAHRFLRSDFRIQRDWNNNLLANLFGAERFLLGRLHLPFGVSSLAVAAGRDRARVK
jgi:hypothetical protein